MKHYSIKMSDGTRYDFDSSGLDWDTDKQYLLIDSKEQNIWLNAMQIISITVSRYGNDS